MSTNRQRPSRSRDDRRWVFEAMMLVVLFASIPGSAQAAPPPNSFLLVSGETLMQGQLPEGLELRNGTINRSEIDPLFQLLPLEEEALYLWSAADDSVTVLNEWSVSLPHVSAAVYRPSEGLLEFGWVIDGQGDDLANAQVDLASGPLTFGQALSETGSFAVFSPELLPPTQSVPEPSLAISLASLVLAGGMWAARWAPSRRHARQSSLSYRLARS